jgi:DNA-binding MarR family transcriptional regulator
VGNGTQATERARPRGGGLDDVEIAAWAGFLRVHATLVRELDAELTAGHGLALTSYDVLIQLDMAPEHRLRMSELADAVLLSRSGLTRLVSRLVNAGMVDRVVCKADQRGAWAVLTDEGARRLAEARETHRAGVRERFLDRFSEDEQRRLGQIWERLLGR